MVDISGFRVSCICGLQNWSPDILRQEKWQQVWPVHAEEETLDCNRKRWTSDSVVSLHQLRSKGVEGFKSRSDQRFNSVMCNSSQGVLPSFCLVKRYFEDS